MADIYQYEGATVLKNKLDIRDEKALELAESEQSRTNMMLLYEEGFDDFSPAGLSAIHQYLFGDIYEWAGKYRVINIAKREKLLAGRSVWYSNEEAILQDLEVAFAELHSRTWRELFRTEFVRELARCFPKIWQVHPFREGNTRTVVMMMTFFVEHHGYHMDQELMALSAGYVRDSFVMASLDQHSEFQHLEQILLDAVCNEPVTYTEGPLETSKLTAERQEKCKRYQKEPYIPEPHYKLDDN